MLFVDEARILVKGGNGGNGCVSFLREKYKPRGGPDGGDGGSGGDVQLKVDEGLKTLMDFRYQRHFFAHKGLNGQGNNKRGRDGADLVLAVPPGTVVKAEDGTVLADLVQAGDTAVIAHGGAGGRGNARFATAKRRGPRTAEEGKPGEERWLFLELKLLADVAVIGYPNSGKSTLINRISSAKAKVGAYPFTTKVPNLGVVDLPEGASFTVADVPGLIEGAHTGVGLGLRFLRHVERARVLVHLLDLGDTGRDPLDDYEKTNAELVQYRQALGRMPQVVVANKIDLPGAREKAAQLSEVLRRRGVSVSAVSGLTGEGTDELVRVIEGMLREKG